MQWHWLIDFYSLDWICSIIFQNLLCNFFTKKMNRKSQVWYHDAMLGLHSPQFLAGTINKMFATQKWEKLPKVNCGMMKSLLSAFGWLIGCYFSPVNFAIHIPWLFLNCLLSTNSLYFFLLLCPTPFSLHSFLALEWPFPQYRYKKWKAYN